jgi:CPA2 family monovalent cation:H+ antiporter-2
VVVELNHAVFSDLDAHTLQGVWGDITSEEILRAAHVESARILVLTVPDLSTVHLSVVRARRLNPKVVVIARAARSDYVGELGKLGVDAVVQAEFEAGVEMVRQALVRYPADSEATSRLVSDARNEFYSVAR